MPKKMCKLCNRTYSHSYKLFGRGCFNTECNLLKINIPKEEKDKEKYFCNVIARRLGKFGISQSKKYDLTQKYLTLEYLKKIKYGDLTEEKKQLENDINNITFNNSVRETIDKLLDNEAYNTLSILTPSITLNKAYRLYKTTLKFSEKMNALRKDIEKAESEDEKVSILNDYIINDLKFIFDTSKIMVPLYYPVFFAMQLAFWELVVIVGREKAGFIISARFLDNALVKKKGYIPKNQTIDSYEDIEKIKEDSYFKDKIDFLIKKYSKHKRQFDININNVDIYDDVVLNFEDNDLFFSLHGTTISVKGKRKENGLYDLIVKLEDTYDFTKIRMPNQYGDDAKHIFGNTLNNMAIVSSQYGVIKTFLVESVIELKNYDINARKEIK